MKDYKDQIDSLYKQACDLRKNLVNEIRDFVKKYGKLEGKKRVLYFDWDISDIIEMPTALLLTDERMDSYSWESVTSIICESDDAIIFDCEYGYSDQFHLPIGHLTDVYNSLLDIQAHLDEGDFMVEDGEVKLAE